MLQLFLNWYINSPFAGKSYFQVLFMLLFDYYGWILVLWLLLQFIILPIYLDTRNVKYKKSQNFITLAIDVPKKNEQSIQAMENVFTIILGAHKTFNWVEKWIEGKFLLGISFEIVSIDGYIQFLIHTPEQWRDLIESAIYSQYPDAEITEVEDYVNNVPDEWPNDTHQMFGVEWSLDMPDYYPIKTYREFEDKFTLTFVDPLAGLLEAMSRLGPGEQIWMHFSCKPGAPKWPQEAYDLVKEIIGEKSPQKKQSLLASLLAAPKNLINEISQQALMTDIIPGGSTEAKEEKKDAFGKLWNMSPGDKERLEMLERKISKPYYEVKIRYGYFAEKDKFNKSKGVESVIGAMKQFNAMGRNGLKPDLKTTGTKADYFAVKRRVAYRQRKMVSALKGRSTTKGSKKKLLNVEELATLWHFPSMFVRIPTLKKTEVVKKEAPVNLPFEEAPEEVQAPAIASVSSDSASLQVEKSKDPLDGELPKITPKEIVEDGGQRPVGQFDYDSDVFEKRFAKDKEAFLSTRKEREERLREIAKEEELIYGQSVADKELLPPERGKNNNSTSNFDYTEDQFTQRFSKEREISDNQSKNSTEQLEVEVLDVHAGHELNKDKQKQDSLKKPEPPENLPFI